MRASRWLDDRARKRHQRLFERPLYAGLRSSAGHPGCLRRRPALGAARSTRSRRVGCSGERMDLQRRAAHRTRSDAAGGERFRRSAIVAWAADQIFGWMMRCAPARSYSSRATFRASVIGSHRRPASSVMIAAVLRTELSWRMRSKTRVTSAAETGPTSMPDAFRLANAGIRVAAPRPPSGRESGVWPRRFVRPYACDDRMWQVGSPGTRHPRARPVLLQLEPREGEC